MTNTPNDKKQVGVSESSPENVKSPSMGNLEGSLSLLDDIFRKDTGSDIKDESKDWRSSGSVVTHLSESLLDRVSKFNANQTDGDCFSPMQSLKQPIHNSVSQLPPLNFSPSPKFRRSTKTLENRIKNFEGNSSDKDFMKVPVDLRSPEEIKKLVKSSRENQELVSILSRYELNLEEESQERRDLAAKRAARDRHRRLGCIKSEEERVILLKINRARLFRSGSLRIVDTDVSMKINDDDKGKVFDEVRAVRYDFTNFASPSFQKAEIQRNLILDVIERSFVFAEFRKYGRARCEGVLDMLINAFEPVSFPPGHIFLDPGMKKENDEFYILERGRIDFKIGGRSVAQIAKVGGYFEELALLYKSTCDRVALVHESSSREAKLLKINQKIVRGILNTCSKQAAQEKRDALLSVDFLSDLIVENEDTIRRLSSIMIREEMKLGEVFNLSQDKTFVVIRSGQMRVTNNSNEIFGSGDYLGSRALIQSLPRVSTNETEMVANSANVVFFRIDDFAMGEIVGPVRLQNLMDMRRFATAPLIKEVNLSHSALEFMADTIAEEKICNGEDSTWEVDQNDPPAVYVVRRGTLVVTSDDKSTGGQIETLVTAGNAFGLDQVKLSMDNGRPVYQRQGGLRIFFPGDLGASIGVLPLDEVELDVKDGIITPINTKPQSYPFITDSHKQSKNKETSKIKLRHSESPILQLRTKVREIVQRKTSLEDLEKIRLLGEGEFGEVWLVAADILCEGSVTKQKFALKSQLILDDSGSIDATDAILREIEMMKALRHSQLVDLVNTYQGETHIHMLMRLVPCGELWDRMHVEDDQGNWSSGLPNDHAKFYAMSIADTLSFIHSRGIIYRDLKPENVLIDIDGYPVIVDFGFAKFCPDKTYTFVGTPNYVAPEIITNAGHNRCVDFWALGVTVYEMVTGENPFFFEGMDQVSLYHTICHEKYFALPEDESEEFVDFVDSLLKKDPIERLGMLQGGVMDILQHRWFDGIELAQIQTKSFPAPWKPTELILDGFENLRLKEKEHVQNNDSSFSLNESIGSISNLGSINEIEEFHGSSTRSSSSKSGQVHELSISSSSKLSSSSKSGEIREIHISPSSKSGDTEELSVSSDSEAKTTKRKKKSRKSSSKKPDPDRFGSGSNRYDNPDEFQFVVVQQVENKRSPKIRNRYVRRTLTQKKQSQTRRDLLKDSFENFGIE